MERRGYTKRNKPEGREGRENKWARNEGNQRETDREEEGRSRKRHDEGRVSFAVAVSGSGGAGLCRNGGSVAEDVESHNTGGAESSSKAAGEREKKNTKGRKGKEGGEGKKRRAKERRRGERDGSSKTNDKKMHGERKCLRTCSRCLSARPLRLPRVWDSSMSSTTPSESRAGLRRSALLVGTSVLRSHSKTSRSPSPWKICGRGIDRLRAHFLI